MKKKIFKINKEKKEQKPKKLFLMITVLERGKSQKFIPILEKHDVVVQMTMLGKGTASSEILNYLGLAENEKDILFSLVKEDKIHLIYQEVSPFLEKKGYGISFTIPLTSIVGKTLYQYLIQHHKGVKKNGKKV